MKQIIFSFFFFILISFVYGQVSPTSTMSGTGSVSMSLSNTVSPSVSMSFSNTVSPSVSTSFSVTVTGTSSLTGSMSTSTSMSFTQTITQTVTGTPSWSISRSYTITRSMSTIHYFAPTNIFNTCSNEKGLICLTWDATVVSVTYDSYNVIYQVLNGQTNYLYSGIKGPRYVIAGLQAGTGYLVSVQGVIGSIISPWSPSYLFTTAADVRNGVNSIDCSITTSNTVDCSWNNGKNIYTIIAAKLYCSGAFASKRKVKGGLSAVSLTGVPAKTSVCQVDFKIKYNKFSTQKFSTFAYLLN